MEASAPGLSSLSTVRAGSPRLTSWLTQQTNSCQALQQLTLINIVENNSITTVFHITFYESRSRCTVMTKTSDTLSFLKLIIPSFGIFSYKTNTSTCCYFNFCSSDIQKNIFVIFRDVNSSPLYMITRTLSWLIHSYSTVIHLLHSEMQLLDSSKSSRY